MPKVTEMYAWVFDDPEEAGGEYIGGMVLPSGVCLMVCSQRQPADLMRRLATKVQQETGRMGRLVRFTERTVIEELPA